jgi:hypothetical protein
MGSELYSEAVPRNTLLIGIDEAPPVPMQMGDPERNNFLAMKWTSYDLFSNPKLAKLGCTFLS